MGRRSGEELVSTTPDDRRSSRDSYISASYIINLSGSGVDPGEVTGRVGLEPTWVFREGHRPSPEVRTPARATSWILRKEQRPAGSIALVLRELVHDLIPASAVLADIARLHDSAILITIKPGDSLPLMEFDADLLSLVASLAVPLHFDIQADLMLPEG